MIGISEALQVESGSIQADEVWHDLRVQAAAFAVSSLKVGAEVLGRDKPELAAKWFESANIATRLTGNMQDRIPGILGLTEAIKLAVGLRDASDPDRATEGDSERSMGS